MLPDGASQSRMAELLRSMAGRLRAFVGNRRRAPRYRLRLPCAVALHDARPAARTPRRAPGLEGHTCDLSSTGLALILPAVRIGDRYLTGPDQRLRLTLEHPTGPLTMIVAPVRHVRLEESSGEAGFVVGVHIEEMDAESRARYDEHLSALREGKR